MLLGNQEAGFPCVVRTFSTLLKCWFSERMPVENVTEIRKLVKSVHAQHHLRNGDSRKLVQGVSEEHSIEIEIIKSRLIDFIETLKERSINQTAKYKNSVKRYTCVTRHTRVNYQKHFCATQVCTFVCYGSDHEKLSR